MEEAPKLKLILAFKDAGCPPTERAGLLSRAIPRRIITMLRLAVFALALFTLCLANGEVNPSQDEALYAEIPHDAAAMNEVDAQGYTALMKVAAAGKVDFVKNYIKAGADIRLTNAEGNSALFLAAKNGLFYTSLELIHAAGAEAINQRNAYHMTPFLVAVSSGHVDIAQAMLDHGAVVDAALPDGTTALMVAAQRGKAEMVRLLIDKKAAIESTSSTGTTALMLACLSGHLPAAAALLGAGAAVDARDSRGLTALLVAAARGHGHVVEALILAGAAVDAEDKLGRSACVHGIEAGSAQVIDCLVAYGAALPASGFSASSEAWEFRRRRMEGTAEGEKVFGCKAR